MFVTPLLSITPGLFTNVNAGIKYPVITYSPLLELLCLCGRILKPSGFLNILARPSRFGPESPPVPQTNLVPNLLPRISTRAVDCIYVFTNTGFEPASSKNNLSTRSPRSFLGLSQIRPRISDFQPYSSRCLLSLDARLCVSEFFA